MAEFLGTAMNNLKTELAANTQSHGENTLSLDRVENKIDALASETETWREDDGKHHKEEKELDEKKIELLKKAIDLFEGSNKDLGFEKQKS